MLSEETQTQKDAQGVIPLAGNVQSRPIHWQTEWAPGGQGLGSAEWREVADGDRCLFLGGRMFWNVNTVNFTI